MGELVPMEERGLAICGVPHPVVLKMKGPASHVACISWIEYMYSGKTLFLCAHGHTVEEGEAEPHPLHDTEHCLFIEISPRAKFFIYFL